MADVIPFPPAPVFKALGSRPAPPADMLDKPDEFAPAPDLGEWVRATFIESDGPLHNPRHQHLLDAEIGWLWTTAEHKDRDRYAAGTCQLVPPQQAKWHSARQHWWLRTWFGLVPDFLITISVPIAAEMDDWAFCALIEHELCHAAQDVDAFGEPRFSQEGKPLFRVVGHDVEQFHDVVERYGARASDVERMTQLANAGPTIGEAQMTAACGTCARRMA